ncbi:hypothetical protein PENTCL1PPCAC_2432 [Pristionchus entomophagus]|uniref:C2H2-type domain-containing protein n=1 Tax=Pristionchus entomophagus TaxID=358040 RepID=A0AAV5SC40_9BILA|nr:hypothetical protein PENTCL1PPCAC_2432 [Pristionchus entomophagus]
MEGFSNKLDDLYLSFRSLGSTEQRERAVNELSVALQRMSATIDSPSDVLAEEATRIIAAEYGTEDWNAPSTSYDTGMMDSSPYDVAHEMYDYSEALREEEKEETGGMSLLNYWKENNYDDSTIPPSMVVRGWTEEERRKRLIGRNDDINGATELKRMRFDQMSLEEEEDEVDEEVELIGCALCGIVLDSYEGYLSHMKLSHVERDENEEEKIYGEEKKKEWKCAECDYVAGSRKTLWRHGKSTGHDWAKREVHYSCDKCDYTAGSKFNLDRHRMRNHSEPQEVECPLCFSILPSIPSFLSHHDSCHREKTHRFQCQLCAKQFTKRTN